MAKVKREELKDITDATKELTDLVKEDYLAWFEFTTSLWEENRKVLNSQLDKWLSLQGDYINLMRDFSQKIPNEGMKMWNEFLKPLNAQTDRFMSIQKDYIESTRSASDKFTKGFLSLNQKSIERALSAFSDYVNPLDSKHEEGD